MIETNTQSVGNFAIEVIGPVVLLIAFGYFLYKRKVITDSFVNDASSLIFYYALPTLLFVNISSADLSTLLDIKSIAIGTSATLIVFIISIIFASSFVNEKENKGVLTQGIFRANMGVIGLAFCAKAYGSEGLAQAAIYMGCLTIVYNALSVFVLNLYHEKSTNVLSILLNIATNPIILGTVMGLLFAFFKIPMPGIAETTLGYFSQITLPLALICSGAALRFSALGELWKLVSIGVIGKCVIYPTVAVTLAISFNVDGVMLGILYLMSMSPTAAASYIMVKKIGGNHLLAAQLIAISTIVSLPMTIVGFYLLSKMADLSLY
ncbi:MAG: AEC family transporter [Pseudomonadota bacterium]